MSAASRLSNPFRLAGLLLALAGFSSGIARAGVNRWTSLGLPGQPPVFAAAVDPRDSSTLYAGTIESGILRTTDGGAHWAAANLGLLDSDVWSLAGSPADSSTVFEFATSSSLSSGGPVTTGGLYRSVNGGLSWSKALDHPGSALAIDPVSPSGIDGLFKTADGGRTCEAVASGLGGAGVDALAVDPSFPSTLYAATTV